MATTSTRVSSRGRVVIPVRARVELGIAKGDVLTVEVVKARGKKRGT